MEEAQEKDMDSVASFKSGKSIRITGEQYNVCTQNQMINLLVSSNRYGYIFYATETDGLVLIPSTYIDRESRDLSKSSEDDDDDDENDNIENSSIIHRSYIPGQLSNKNSPIIPYWLSLNADETILALVLLQADTHSWLIFLYDVAKFIQMPDSQPYCSPVRLPGDAIGDTIQNFTWNPAIPTRFAYLDGNGSVVSLEIDQNSRQIKVLGLLNADNDNSSICWSSRGKQIAVVKYDGTLELYEPNMILKKTHPSATMNPSFPPCISVLWISTHQFLLGFSEDNSDDNTYFHILVTYEKDQPPKTQIYKDLFFDALDASLDINPQYFYARLNESKLIITGLSKSLKINVLGPDELNQDSLLVWTFADQFRATVKGSTNVNTKRPILTGMTLGLNSTLSISDGNNKLPPCPILLLSTNEGVLQVYYFICKNLPSSYRKPEEIKPIQAPVINPPNPGLPQASTSINGSSFNNFGSTPTTPIQSKGPNNNPNFSSNLPPPTKSVIDDISKSIGATGFNIPTPVQQTPAKPVTDHSQPSSNNKKLFQMVDEFQSKLKSLQKPISKPSESSINLDQILTDLIATLNTMTTSLETSIRSIKTMTNEHIESLTKIENARHHIKLTQKENFYESLKDRELDPWTQARLDSIESKYDQLKHNLNVLLQLTRATIHDRSLSNTTDDDDETENEDFLPDLEISLNTNETMKQRIQKRILELSHKVSETEKDLDNICTKLNTDLLSSSTFNKTTMSSTRSFHASDAEILSHLQATHPKVLQIRVPSAPVINLSSTNEQKPKQSTIEINKPSTPLTQPSTPKQTNSPTIESESFKNMLRIVRTSIDLFSGATSPEQLQELSNTIATSPISSTQKSNMTSSNKTPTISKTTSLSNTPITTTKPLQTTMISTNILQTPAKSVNSPIPTISVTPATPATQAFSLDTSIKLQPNKPIVQTATDLTKTQSMSGDSAIRSLLNNTVSSPTTITSISNQPIVNTTQNQVTAPTFFGNTPSISTAQVTSQSSVTTAVTPVISTPSSIQSAFGTPPSPASTAITSLQSTSPTSKPIMSTGFGSKPIFGGTAFGLTPTTSSSLPFGGTATTTPTGPFFGSAATSAASTSTSFGAGFGTAITTTATTSTPSTGAFSIPASSIPSPFGSGFGSTPATTTSSAPTASIFGTSPTSPASPFGSGFGSALNTATTSAPSTGIFGGGFGSNTTATSPSPFGSSFNTATTTSSTTPFGAAPSISAGSLFGGFNAVSSTAPTSSTSSFGSNAFGFNPTSPATSTATSTAGTSTFGSGFSGFNTQSNSSGQSTSFSFGGFGSQPSDATKTQSSFGSFGSPPAATQAPSPFGGSLFGGASGQSPGFGTTTSSFGAPPTQSTNSSSFTTYRK